VGRRDYAHVVLTCHKGVNEQRDKASPEECASALNVWSPDGKIEQRPGYEAVTALGSGGPPDTGETSQIYLSETTGGTVVVAPEDGSTLSLNNWAVGAHWYIGIPSPTGTFGLTGTRKVSEVRVNVAAANGNASGFKANYWNGEEWKYLAVRETDWYEGQLTTPHLGRTPHTAFMFTSPGDWAAKTIAVSAGGTQTAYWIRFTITDAALDASVTLTNAATTTQRVSPEHNEVSGLFVAQFPSVRRYTFLATLSGGFTTYAQAHDFYLRDANVSTGVGRATEQSLATHAAVPDFNEGYIAFGGEVVRYEAHEDWASTAVNDRLAKVEDGDFAVGEDAPYDPTLIAQLSEFPKGRYVSFFKNRLWMAGIEDEPFTVRWSAGGVYRRVWPSLSFEPIIEDDNSPITGMVPLGEQMIVFKQDSIWAMVNVGENPRTGVQHYDPVRIVAGVGCVSHASIQQVRGSLIFLSEDGVYAFDGTPNIQKISDNIENTVASIVPTRRGFATSINWKTHSCYLLSVATAGSYDNNKTLVFDYKNNAWWIWDIPASLWFKDEDQLDLERIYFIDKHGSTHLMGAGNHDHGAAISSEFTTQRVNEGGNIRHTLRQVETTSTNLTGDLEISVRANDDEAGETSGTLSLADSTDAAYGTAVDGTTAFSDERYVARRLGFRKQGDWVQVKVAHSGKNKPMAVRSLDLGFLRGPRR
jgi:hypothetical protein